MITKKADELPEITSACFHESHAGKQANLITGKYHSIIKIFLGIEDADLRACSCEKSEMVLSRGSTDSLMG